MLRHLMGDRYSCGLDIGAQSLKACILRIRESEPPLLLGMYESKTCGFRQNAVHDLSGLSECIHGTVSELTRRTGVKLKDLHVGLNGELVEPRFSTAIMPLMDWGSKVITPRDVRKIQSQARMLGAGMEEAVLHDLPQYYKVDDTNTALNPAGLYGRKLELRSLLVITNNTLLKNLTKAVHQAGYEPLNFFFTGCAGAEASLNEHQRRQGCVLVDVGAGMTDLLMFKDGHLRHFRSLPIGGEAATQGIAERLTLSLELAGDIKESYAMASGPEDLCQEEILIKGDDRYFPVKRGEIGEAIQPAVDSLVEALFTAIQESGLYEQMNAGIIMVGGGALLPGLPELVEAKTKLPVRVGKVNIAIKRLNSSAKYAACVGLAQLGLVGGDTGEERNNPWPARMANRLKDLYQEYF